MEGDGVEEGTQFLITKNPLELVRDSVCWKVFLLWNCSLPLPTWQPLWGPSPTGRCPLPSGCLLSWLNIAGSSVEASWTWRGHPPLPRPCLSLSSALGVGYVPVSDPKDWSQPGGETWLQAAEGGNGGNRGRMPAEQNGPGELLLSCCLTPPRAWVQGLGRSEGGDPRPKGSDRHQHFGTYRQGNRSCPTQGHSRRAAFGTSLLHDPFPGHTVPVTSCPCPPQTHPHTPPAIPSCHQFG